MRDAVPAAWAFRRANLPTELVAAVTGYPPAPLLSLAICRLQCKKTDMSKRLAMLEKLTSSGKSDSFTWYALALEYRSADRIDDAVHTFESLRESDPTYIPMYQIAGSMLIDAGRDDEARAWLEEGMVRANVAGDVHARDEMKGLLESIS